MPTGSFDFSPYPPQLAMNAIPIGVFLYNSGFVDDPFNDTDGPYTLLPNIRCEQIQYKEGPEPPTARFSYILDELSALAEDIPSQFEQIFPLGTAPSNYVVTMADELVVLALLPDGTTRVLFHGYPRVPQTDVSPASQHVTFVAVGVAVRCWDTPIGGRMQRDGNSPQNGVNVQTDLPVRFNPAGTGTRAVGGILPNCTPDGYDVNQGGDEPYPVFLDSSIDRDPDPRTFWGLSKAVRYILATQNTVLVQDEQLLVDNPDFSVLDALLQDRRPLDGSEFFDPRNPATYQTNRNVIRDYDATNKPWPAVVGQLLGFYGFGMRFVCEDDGDGNPYDYLEFYRKDAAGPTEPKSVYLPSTGANLTDAITNLSALHAAFDFHGVANDVFIESHLERWEVSIVLAPGFQPASGDGNAATRTQFLMSNLSSQPATAAQRLAYRCYLADECADGHWSIAGHDWITDTAFDFSAIFNDGADNTTYVNRYRPGMGTLFSKDLNNKPRKAQLAISHDYIGADPPCFRDLNDTSTWQQIGDGTWDLLPDRLGITVTVEDVDGWKIGKPPKGNAPNGQPWPFPDGMVSGIRSMANPTAATSPQNPSQQFWLLLTTVIEADAGIGTEALRRDASPLAQTVQRRVDASDHFHYDAIDVSSCYNTTQDPILAQDDTNRAFAHASQLRSAHEFPPLTAALTIPYLAGYISIGHRIDEINGRDVSLLVNAGAEQGEAASYPYVVALTWDFQEEKQATTIQLSDRRLEPRRPTA